MFSRITLSPAMRDGKAIDVAGMLLEAADVERAAHLNPSHHRQHIGRRDDTEREFAEGRKGITLKPGQQPRSMPASSALRRWPCHLRAASSKVICALGLFDAPGSPPSPSTTLTLARRSRASASETAG